MVVEEDKAVVDELTNQVEKLVDTMAVDAKPFTSHGGDACCKVCVCHLCGFLEGHMCGGVHTECVGFYAGRVFM